MSAEKLDAIKTSLAISPRWIDILARNSELIRDSIDHLLQGFQEGRRPLPVDIIESLNRAIVYSIESSATQHNITVEKSIEVDRALVLSPPGHLLHLLLNLLTNAREAIGTRPGIIRTSVRLGTGNKVVVEIADTGPGIPQTVIDRLGEPFVTTKPGGTGLGLSLILRIVRDCGGQIEADSPKAGGSRFIIQLPLTPPTHS
jgi:two-component system C4-dicarboxylate transport sensor histidine kinase DctB